MNVPRASVSRCATSNERTRLIVVEVVEVVVSSFGKRERERERERERHAERERERERRRAAAGSFGTTDGTTDGDDGRDATGGEGDGRG